MDLPWDLILTAVALVLPALGRAVAVVVTALTATFARRPDRRRAAYRALTTLIRREEDRGRRRR